MGRLISEEHECKRKQVLRISSHFGYHNLVAIIFVWEKCLQKRTSELGLGEYLTRLKWEINIRNEQQGAVFSKKESQFNETSEYIMRLWGSLVSLWSFCCMNHSSPWRVSPHPKGKGLHHGSFLAIYEQLLEKTRSKSRISPCEQKWRADGGVNSQPWASFETVQSLGASHWCGRAPYAGQPTPAEYNAFCMVLLWQRSKKPAPSPPPVLQVFSPLCRANIPFSLFWFSQTHRTILRNPVSGLIIYFVYLVL